MFFCLKNKIAYLYSFVLLSKNNEKYPQQHT